LIAAFHRFFEGLGRFPKAADALGADIKAWYNQDMRIYFSFNFEINRLVRNFILVDLFLIGGWGLIEPILSLYIVGNVRGATLATVGTAAAVYWITKALLQFPIAGYLDRTAGEDDDLRALIIGLLVASFSAMGFVFVHQIWQLYIIQIFHAAAFALYSASWPAIFSRHLDKGRVSFDWTLDSMVVSVSAGVSGFLGGVIASAFGFPAVFILTSLLSLAAAIVAIFAPAIILPSKSSGSPVKMPPSSTMGK